VPFPVFAYTSKGPLLLDQHGFDRVVNAGAKWLFKNKYGPETEALQIGQAIDELKTQRSKWRWVRKNAMDALVRIGEPAKPALLKTLNGGDRFARDCAVEALMTLGMPLPESVVSEGGKS